MHTSLHTFPSSSLSLISHPFGLFSSPFHSSLPWALGEQWVSFHGGNLSASTLANIAKVLGRFTHEAGLIRRSLELRFETRNCPNSEHGLQWMAPLDSEFLASFRLQIDSTDRCEYSATSVDVVTHYFMPRFDLGTLEKLNNGIMS